VLKDIEHFSTQAFTSSTLSCICFICDWLWRSCLW